jgi:hypothetical protein
VAEPCQENFDLFFVLEAGVVGPNGNLHGRKDRGTQCQCQENAQ